MPITPTSYLSIFQDDMTVFFDNSPDLLCVLNADHRIVRVNKAWRRFGYEPGQIDLGETLLFDLFLSEGVARLRTILDSEDVSSYAADVDLSENWFQMKNRDGNKTYYIRLRGVYPQHGKNYLIMFDGTHMIRNAMDIIRHERQSIERESNLYYNLILTHSFGGSLVIDTLGTITFCSTASIGIIGWSPEDLRGQPIGKFIYEEERIIITSAIGHLIAVRPFGQARHFAHILVKPGSRPDPYLMAELLLVEMTRDPVIEGVIINYRATAQYGNWD